MSEIDIEARLEESLGRFLLSLRQGEGFRPEFFDDVKNLLNALSHELRDKDYIRKRTAGILVEIDPAIASSLTWYGDQECSDITHAADEIRAMIYDFLF